MYQNHRDALCQDLRTIGWQVSDSHGSIDGYVRFVLLHAPEKILLAVEAIRESGILNI